MLKTIIHIGQHKTGTTSIQHYLRNNRQDLVKHGLYYPDSLSGFDNPSHFLLNVYSLNKFRYSPMKEMLLKNETPEFFLELKNNLESDIARHYEEAERLGCKEIVWSNEGLYLLNSSEEYHRLLELFSKHSAQVVCVCCFREIESFKKSYLKTLETINPGSCTDKDSYRYIESDSWLFDVDRKKSILSQVFENTIYLSYNPTDMIKTFMDSLGYQVFNTSGLRLNITPLSESAEC